MNKDQVNGRIEEAKGRVKEAVGKAVGDKMMEKTGKVNKLKGAVKAKYGDAKEELKKSI